MLSLSPPLILTLSLLPYLGLAAYDGWLHEKARRVPRIEQGLHALIAIAVVTAVGAIFLHRAPLAWSALAVFLLAEIADEVGFHALLSRRERRVHFAAYACFAGFVATALWLGALQ